jgi:hypothetical protein
VAIDLQDDAPELEAWLTEHDPERTVRTFYGVDQADRGALRAIVDEVFGDEPLDLVIDDASHLYDETRQSFNVLFPRLRVGGFYGVEDWSWLQLLEAEILSRPETRAIAAAEVAAGADTSPDTSTTPSRLLFEQLHALAGHTNAVDRLVVERLLALARRGGEPLDPETFDIGDCYGPLGALLVPPAAR